EPISGSISVAGTRVEKRLFDRQQMYHREMLLSCNTGCFTITMRKKFDSMKQGLSTAAPLISQQGSPNLKATSEGGNGRLKASSSNSGSGRLKASLPLKLDPVSSLDNN